MHAEHGVYLVSSNLQLLPVLAALLCQDLSLSRRNGSAVRETSSFLSCLSVKIAKWWPVITTLAPPLPPLPVFRDKQALPRHCVIGRMFGTLASREVCTMGAIVRASVLAVDALHRIARTRKGHTT